MMVVAAWLSCALLGFSMPTTDVLLRVRINGMSRDGMEQWLKTRGFQAVLPIQPMLIQPLTPPLSGLELTFRRKPNSEKGGRDGGLRFTIAADDDETGVLLVSRISEGQYTSKVFSERKLLRRVLDDLDKLPAECGTVSSVVDLSADSAA